MAVVDQAFVDNLRDEICVQLINAVDQYQVRLQNGIDCVGYDADIAKLKVLYSQLGKYDVTESYFDETFIRKINREWDIFCKYSKFVRAADDTVEKPSGIGFLSEYYFNPTQVVGAATTPPATGIFVPDTPELFMFVEIDGNPVDIGDGVTNLDVWFSDITDTNGTTARRLQDIQANDQMFYNRARMMVDLALDAQVKFSIL